MAREKKRDLDASMELLWGDQGRPRRGPKPSMSAERIAARAIAIADAEGLDAVSMQRVAEEFDVTPMALYRYVPGKAELVDLMVDVAGTPPPDLTGTPGGWRPRLAEWARQCWALYRRHPWILPATAMRRQVMGPHQLAWLEAALDVLAGTGLSAGQQHQTFLLVIGHVRNQARQLADADAEGLEGWDRLTAEVLRRHRHRFPALGAAIEAGAFAPREGDPLDFGLERILDGVAALVERAGGDGPPGTAAGTVDR